MDSSSAFSRDPSLPLRPIGCGTAATVYHIPSSSQCLKVGQNHSLLRDEFTYASQAVEIRDGLYSSARFGTKCPGIHLPLVPHYREIHHSASHRFWDAAKPRLQTQCCADDDDDDGNDGANIPGSSTAILMDRIPPLPKAVGTMLIKRFFDESAINAALENQAERDFVIRLCFGDARPGFNICGRDSPHPSPPRSNLSALNLSDINLLNHLSPSSSPPSLSSPPSSSLSSSLSPFSSFNTPNTLRDFPAPLPLLKSHLRTRTHKIVRSIAAGLAILHWGCHLDGMGVEFVLGGGKSIATWMLDFDQCRPLEFPTDGEITPDKLDAVISNRLVYAIMDGGYVPSSSEEEMVPGEPGEGTTCKGWRGRDGESLWDCWKDTYITVGQYLCRYKHNNRGALRAGPSRLCEAVELEMARKHMGLSDSNSDEAVVFVGISVEEDDRGWGSDEADEDVDDSSDGEDDGYYYYEDEDDDEDASSDLSGEDEVDQAAVEVTRSAHFMEQHGSKDWNYKHDGDMVGLEEALPTTSLSYPASPEIVILASTSDLYESGESSFSEDDDSQTVCDSMCPEVTPATSDAGAMSGEEQGIMAPSFVCADDELEIQQSEDEEELRKIP